MKDEIFAEGKFQRGSFRFNDAVASVFDDMATRCIPYYQEVIQLSASAADKFIPDNGLVYDIGSSTGNTLLFIAKALRDKKINLIGIDPSESMLNKAREKASVYTYSHDIQFLEGSAESFDFKKADMIILNYTLQFIEVSQRPALIQKLYDSLNPGGMLLLSEKLCQEDEDVQEFNTETYEAFKAGNGYSYLEIANKRQALENILVPGSLSSNLDLLQDSGFHRIEIIFKWLNFTTFLAFK